MTYHDLAAYARLSKNPDGTLTSVDEQVDIMQGHAGDHGNRITAIFADDDLSAWDTDIERPGWQAFIKALDSGEHDGAMSYHFDRLSRNGRDSEALLTVTTKHALPLVTPEQVLDLGANSDARFVFRIQSAMAIQQSDATSRRVRDKKDLYRARGNLRYVLGGSPVVGFRDGADDWETDPAHAAVLADVAARMLAGEPLAAAFAAQPQIVTNPTEGKPNSGGAVVNEKMIRAALKRPATAGLMTSRQGDIIGHAMTDPPLPEVTWRRVQTIFDTRKRGRVATADYPLGKWLRCGKCGNQLSGGPVAGVASYCCKNPHPKLGITKPCRGVSIRAEQLHELVREALEAWSGSSPRFAAASQDQAGMTARKAELETQIEQAQEWLADLTDKRLGGYLSAARFNAAEAEHMAQIDSLRAELAQVAAAEAEPVPADLDWDGMTGAERRTLVALAFETPIVVMPGKGGPKRGSAADQAAERVTLTVRD